MKNFTAFELSRFIDKSLTKVAHSHRNYRSGSADLAVPGGDDQQGMAELKKKLWRNNNRVEAISNQTNFRDIENPFGDYSFTLQNLKKEKHEKWLVRKAEKQM